MSLRRNKGYWWIWIVTVAWVLSLAFIHECQAQNKGIIKFGNSGPNTVVTGVDSITMAVYQRVLKNGEAFGDTLTASTWKDMYLNDALFDSIGLTHVADSARLSLPPGIYLWEHTIYGSVFDPDLAIRVYDHTNGQVVGYGSTVGIPWSVAVVVDAGPSGIIASTQVWADFSDATWQYGSTLTGVDPVVGICKITRIGDSEQIGGNIAQDIVSFAVEQATQFYGVGNDNLGEPAAADGAIVVGKSAGSDTAQTISNFRYLSGKMGINYDGAMPGTLSLGQFNAGDAGPSIVFDDTDTLNSSPYLQFRRDFIDGFTVAQDWPKEHFKIQGSSEGNAGQFVNFNMRVMQEGIGTFFNPNSFDITTTDASEAIFTRWGIDKDGEIKYWRPLVEASDTAKMLVREGDGKIRGRFAPRIIFHQDTMFLTSETYRLTDMVTTLDTGWYEFQFLVHFDTVTAGGVKVKLDGTATVDKFLAAGADATTTAVTTFGNTIISDNTGSDGETFTVSGVAHITGAGTFGIYVAELNAATPGTTHLAETGYLKIEQ